MNIEDMTQLVLLFVLMVKWNYIKLKENSKILKILLIQEYLI